MISSTGVSAFRGWGRSMLAGLLIMTGLACCPKPDPAPEPRAALPLIVGMEYAQPGLAQGLSGTLLPGVKFLPELIGWDRMQPTEDAAINFTMLDRLVSEYQKAGFTDCMLGLKSESPWAAIDLPDLLPSTNVVPKPEYMDEYAAWVQAVVERYDGDGLDDMPGLKCPVRYIEIGVEFSSFEPEPVEDYLDMLEAAYAAAHAASPEVIVMHAAFLPGTAFADNPGPEEYEAAFAAVSSRIMYHTLDEIRAILDLPDLFDAVNVHVLSAAEDVEAAAAWLRYEMDTRGYDKPIVISDTSPNPFIGWGPATACDDPPESMGLLMPPATEADRCRLADFFNLLIAADADTLAWTHGFVAGEMAKMSVVAAEQGIAFINTTFMEDLIQLQWPIMRASAGLSAWAGMAAVTINLVTQEHTITALRPLYHALRQLMGHMDGCDAVVRLEAEDARVRLYEIQDLDGDTGSRFIGWYEPETLLLPGDAVPEATVSLDVGASKATLEWLIIDEGVTTPERQTLAATGGQVTFILTPTPVFVLPE